MASTPKPARNRLRRSCDVCFKSKTKCDDNRPCNSCIRRKCEDRCVTSGQLSDVGQAASLLDGIQRAVSTSADRTNGVDGHIHSTNSSHHNSSNGSSLKTSTHQPEPALNWNRAQSPFQAWDHRRSLSLEEATARDLLGLREQAKAHARQIATDAKLEHTWDEKSPHEGRTHFSWLLRKFADITPQIEDDSRNTKRRKLTTSTFTKDQNGDGRHYERNGFLLPADVWIEVPDLDGCNKLTDLFFRNYAQIFPILQHEDVQKAYDMVMPSRERFSSNPDYAVMLLLVLLLGDTLLEPDKHLIPPEVASKWLDQAQLWQSHTLRDGSFSWEQLQVLVLVNLTQQVSRINLTADWISIGSAIRASMTSGLHKPPSTHFGSGYTARVLWSAFLELDLKASLAAGLIPITTSSSSLYGVANDVFSLNINQAWNGLASILNLRHDILMKLNGDVKVQHQTAIQLARQLTSTVGPLLKSGRKTENLFGHEYLSFTYRRFVFALHRPFAIMEDPAFHFSQRICSRLALQHIERICRIHQLRPIDRTPFENLMVRYKGTFWDETFQSIMFLCHSLLRTQSVEDEIMDTIMLGDDLDGSDSHGVSTSSIRRVIQRFVPSAEDALDGDWLSEQMFLVPASTLAYLDVVKQYPDPKDLDDRNVALKEAQQRLVQLCLDTR